MMRYYTDEPTIYQSLYLHEDQQLIYTQEQQVLTQYVTHLDEKQQQSTNQSLAFEEQKRREEEQCEKSCIFKKQKSMVQNFRDYHQLTPYFQKNQQQIQGQQKLAKFQRIKMIQNQEDVYNYQTQLKNKKQKIMNNKKDQMINKVNEYKLNSSQRGDLLKKANQLQYEWQFSKDYDAALSSISFYKKCQQKQCVKRVELSLLKCIIQSLIRQRTNGNGRLYEGIEVIKIKNIMKEFSRIRVKDCFQIYLLVTKISVLLNQEINITQNIQELKLFLDKEKGQKLIKQKFEYYQLLGDYYQLIKDIKKAYQQYQLCLKIYPQNKTINDKIQNLCSKSNEIKKTHKFFQKTLQIQKINKLITNFVSHQQHQALLHKQIQQLDTMNTKQPRQINLQNHLEQKETVKQDQANTVQKKQQEIDVLDISSHQILQAKSISDKQQVIGQANQHKQQLANKMSDQEMMGIVGMATFYWQDSSKNIYRSSQGSGFFISPTLFITVKHNFYLKSNPNTRCTRCEINVRNISGNHELRTYKSIPSLGWFQSKDYDLGAVILQQPINDFSYNMQIVNRDDMISFKKDMDLTLFGYSLNYRMQDKPDTLKQISAKFITYQNNTCIYNASTTEGLSGSPIFSPPINNKRKLIGLHMSRNTVTNNCKAILFNDRMRAQIQSWYRSYIDRPSKTLQQMAIYKEKYLRTLEDLHQLSSRVQKIIGDSTFQFNDFMNKVIKINQQGPKEQENRLQPLKIVKEIINERINAPQCPQSILDSNLVNDQSQMIPQTSSSNQLKKDQSFLFEPSQIIQDINKNLNLPALGQEIEFLQYLDQSSIILPSCDKDQVDDERQYLKLLHEEHI